MSSTTPRRRALAPLVSLLASGVLVASTTLLAGCSGGGGSDDASTPDATPNVGQSPDMRSAAPLDCLPQGTASANTGSQTDPTYVAWTGSGSKLVLLAPQDDGGPCDWADQITRLAGQGYLVGTFGWTGDASGSLQDALRLLRSIGGTQVALVGAAKGGTVAAALAADVEPVSLVALSPTAQLDGLDAASASSGYTGPLLVVASADDAVVPADSSRLVARADDPATFLELDGAAHGVELFASAHKAEVEQALDAALAAGFAG